MCTLAAQAGRPVVSSWREALGVCSLPTVLVGPLAWLHNWPWVHPPFDAILLVDLAQDLAGRAGLVEAWLLSSLAAWGAVWLPGKRLGWRVRVRVWLMAVGGGLLGVAGFLAVGSTILMYPLAAAVAAAWAASWLVGLPCMLKPALLRTDVLRPRAFALWAVLSVACGGPLSALALQRVYYVGVGELGPGPAVGFLDSCFAWGAGLAAYCTVRRHAGREASEDRPTVRAAGGRSD